MDNCPLQTKFGWAIDFGPSAKNKMAGIEIFKRILNLKHKYDISSAISLTDSNFEILSYVTKKTVDINIGLIS